MPAHIKASLLGPSLTLPVSGGRLATGTWQGIYLCEHRDHGGARSLILTLNRRIGRRSPCEVGIDRGGAREGLASRSRRTA